GCPHRAAAAHPARAGCAEPFAWHPTTHLGAPVPSSSPFSPLPTPDAGPATARAVTAPSPGRTRWLICALLFFATTVNYMDRQILSLVKPILDGELKWSNEQFGVVNAAFQAAYAIGLLGFGALIDRGGTT